MIHGLIPARGGSKGIPGKNTKSFLGEPLISYVLRAFEEICITPDVATDSKEIASLADSVYWRSPQSASDTAQTEEVLVEWIRANKFHSQDIILLAQPTSPYTRGSDLLGVISLLGFYDSVVSVQRNHRFFWHRSDSGELFPINYLLHSRPRRQDNEGLLMENGAIYGSRVGLIMESGCRISGKIGAYEMDKGYELDSEEDWKIGEIIGY